MAIDAVKGSAMSYQGMTSNVSVKPVQESRDAKVQEAQTAQAVAVKTTDFKVRSDSEGKHNTGDNSGNPNEQNEKIRKSVEEINRRALQNNVECQFGVHEGTNRVTIKIVDKETHEVIREVPPEKTLDMIAKAWELAGLMVDERR
ncbi:MAG: flagellar protein FlaG [Lachnospiraceae bacterium]|nr:flagellar protein FlaG [Lachnospiraceae bacterium]